MIQHIIIYYGRPRSPKGSDWDRALLRWKSLPSDSDAIYDKKVSIDASKLTPMVTFGTNPGNGNWC